MSESVFVSTSCFAANDLSKTLNLAETVGLRNLELGICTNASNAPIRELLRTAQRQRGFSFLIHNYFPPPAEDFVLNLASPDQEIAEISP